MQVCAKIYLVMQTDCCSSCPGWLVSDDLGGEDAGCVGPGLVWLHMVCGCEAGWMSLPNSLKRLWRRIWYGREMNIQFTDYSSSWATLWWTFLQSACQLHVPPQTCDICGLCCVIQLHILEWPFIVSSLRYTCVIIMLSNQHLDMPHLWGGWIILAKEKCSLTQI